MATATRSSRKPEHKAPYALDEREAQEAAIEIAAALYASVGSSDAIQSCGREPQSQRSQEPLRESKREHQQQQQQQQQLHRRLTTRHAAGFEFVRFATRNFVDPDHFLMRAAAAAAAAASPSPPNATSSSWSSSQLVVAFLPLTSTVALFSSLDRASDDEALFDGIVWRDGVFSRHRMPAVVRISREWMQRVLHHRVNDTTDDDAHDSETTVQRRRISLRQS